MLLSFVLLAQAEAQTGHLRYERVVQMPVLPPGESSVCAVLDAAAFAHAASRSGDDLRLYRELAGSSVETPFSLLESEAEPEETVAATVENIVVRGRVLSFDLGMPHRAYTAVQLRLAEQDFLAEAVVATAPSAAGGSLKPLGTYTLFDLSAQHLARSTELSLQETTLPRLHVEMRLWRLDGSPVEHPLPGVIQGADVPPSREAQTLYTTVAATSVVGGKGPNRYSDATLLIPAHLPVERVRIVLDPAFTGSFLRNVIIGASAGAPPEQGIGAHEWVEGIISRVDRPAPSADAPAIHYASLAIDDTLGANLRDSATVHVSVEKVEGQPLPVRSVELQMRQRSLCFQAVAGASYSLRYGDASLPPPVYEIEGKTGDAPDDAAEERPAPAKRLLAGLGPELENPAFIAQPPRAVGERRHTEMFWVGLLGLFTLAGVLAAHRVRYEREGN